MPHTAVVSCAGLRRLRFPGTNADIAGQVVLAALALVSLVEQDQAGYALRSRCDLVCVGKAPFEIVHPDGATETFEIDIVTAGKMLKDSVAFARKQGFPWTTEPIRLLPQPRLVELVALSRAKALAGESESQGG